MLRFGLILLLFAGGCAQGADDGSQVTVTLPPPSEAPADAGFSEAVVPAAG